MKQICLMSGVVLILASAAYPALAETTLVNADEDGVDCFYAENAANPLCRPAPSADMASRRADTEASSPVADSDTRTVDCFFAVNREDPLCQPTPAATTALIK